MRRSLALAFAIAFVVAIAIVVGSMTDSEQAKRPLRNAYHPFTVELSVRDR